jgi:hypothetical protein
VVVISADVGEVLSQPSRSLEESFVARLPPLTCLGRVRLLRTCIHTWQMFREFPPIREYRTNSRLPAIQSADL